MAVPVINAIINFSTGPSFAQAMIIDQGILLQPLMGLPILSSRDLLRLM